MSLRIVALLALAASFTFAPANANAGLFGLRGHDCGCAAAPSCGCEMAAPSCGCEIAAPSCGCEVSACDPCGCSAPRMGLLARLKARCAAKNACCDAEPTCGCEIAEPTCGCEVAAPTCGCEIAAPSCGCEVSACDPCGCSAPRVGLLARLKAKLSSMCDKGCDSGCDMGCEPTCGCEIVEPSCGCEVAPSCGCN